MRSAFFSFWGVYANLYANHAARNAADRAAIVGRARPRATPFASRYTWPLISIFTVLVSVHAGRIDRPPRSGTNVDAQLFAIIEALREADEAAELLTDEDLTPVVLADGAGGEIRVYRDGSYALYVDGELAQN